MVQKESGVEILILFSISLMIISNMLIPYGLLTPHAQVNVSEIAPIEENPQQIIAKKILTSTTEMIVLNCTDFKGYNRLNIPFYEYDTMICTLEVEALSDISDFTFSFNTEFNHISKRVNLTEGELITLSIDANLNNARVEYNETGWWILHAYILANPRSDVIFHSLVVNATSFLPLCPVSVDFQTAGGDSLFENPWMNYHWYSPELVLTRNDENSTTGLFRGKQVNETIYLTPGNYTGHLRWVSSWYEIMDVNLTLELDEAALWIIQIPTIKLRLEVQPSLPLCTLRIERYTYNMYRLEKIRLQTSEEFYLPLYPWQNDLEFSLEIVDPTLSYPHGFVLAATHILTNSSDLLVTVTFHHVLFFGSIITPSELLFLSFSLIIFSLVITRIALYFKPKFQKSHRLDYRSLPLVLLLGFGFLPWFYGTRTIIGDTGPVTLDMVFMGPIPLFGFWSHESASVLMQADFLLEWMIIALILYWIPLMYSIRYLTTPSTKENDENLSLLLFLPLVFALIFGVQIHDLVYFEPIPSFVIYAMAVIPMMFLCVHLYLRFNHKYSFPYLETTQLKIDHEKLQHLEGQREGLGTSERPIFGSSLGKFIMRVVDSSRNATKWTIPLIFLSLILPSFTGVVYRYNWLEQFWYVENSITNIPIFGPFYFFEQYDWYQQQLVSMVIVLPYLILSLLTITEIGYMIQGKSTKARALLMAVLTLASIIPGFLLLRSIYAILLTRNYRAIEWSPMPIIAIILIVVVLIAPYESKQSQKERV